MERPPSAPSSTSRRTPSATWSGTRRRGKARSSTPCSTGTTAPAPRIPPSPTPPRRCRGGRRRHPLGAGDPCPRRPPDRRALYQARTGAAIGIGEHTRTCSASSAGSSTRRTSSPKAATSTPVPRWRTLPPRPAHGGVLHVPAIPGDNRLPDREDVSSRHAVHARLRHGAGDFPAAMPMRSSAPSGACWPCRRDALWMCHDYKPPAATATPGRHGRRAARAHPHVKDGVTEADFVPSAPRATRRSPRRRCCCPIQVNIRAGRFPEARRTACATSASGQAAAPEAVA